MSLHFTLIGAGFRQKRPQGIDLDVSMLANWVGANPDASRDRKLIPGADAVCVVEGNMDSRPLDDLVLQGGNRERALPAVSFGNVDPPRGSARYAPRASTKSARKGWSGSWNIASATDASSA